MWHSLRICFGHQNYIQCHNVKTTHKTLLLMQLRGLLRQTACQMLK